MVYVFLAQGFEEIEALAPVDILRRADIEVCTVGIGGEFITGRSGITVKADITDTQLKDGDFAMLVLPGGMPGASNLDESKLVDTLLARAKDSGAWLAAICAAPFVLGKRGLLAGKKAVCYPGFEDQLQGAIITDAPVQRDEGVITAVGPGAAVDFALELVRALRGEETANEIKAELQCKDSI